VYYIEAMGMAQKIRILLVKQGNISEAELARRLHTTSANLHQKMKRDNFSEKELREIGEAVGCDVKIVFVDKQTGDVT
jgi:transcriptional regulator